MTPRDEQKAARREVNEIADLLVRVATALRDSPEHVIFANGGAGETSIRTKIDPISFDAYAWPDVPRIMGARGRLNQANVAVQALARRR